MITTFYLAYITLSIPHIEYHFNLLEIFNEISFLVLVYTFLGYTTSSDIEPFLSPEVQYKLGSVSLSIMAIVYSVNFIAMVCYTIQ